ncbi:hypothetical protein MNBD_NITROSPINAE02-2018 [hydrothermal vent metagenome]|uniref:AB hydrolase-1 domain-containing protein n=1 Tax=hydrothermal vent metagenome TaxID=652676 RepID=A0A3B1CIP9_9ZZZZ
MTAKPLFLVLLIVILVVVSLRSIIKIVEPKFLFHPDRSLELSPKMLGLKYTDVTIKSGNQNMHGWYFPGNEKNGVVVFYHGNAGNMADRLSFIKFLKPLQLNILMIDYRGYGNSQGYPSIKGIEEDGVATVEWLLNNNKIKPRQIVLWGRSMGGAAALAAASEYPDVAGVIAESTFISLRAIAADFAPWAPVALITDRWKNAEILASLKTPKLIIHGVNDSLIPFYHGEELYSKAAEPKQIIPVKGADHNNTYIVGGSVYKKMVGQWIYSRLR